MLKYTTENSPQSSMISASIEISCRTIAVQSYEKLSFSPKSIVESTVVSKFNSHNLYLIAPIV